MRCVSNLLPNQTWIHWPFARLWRREEQRLLQVPSKENGQLVLKRPKLLDAFLARDFEGNVKEGVAKCMMNLCIVLGLVGIKMKLQALWFQPV